MNGSDFTKVPAKSLRWYLYSWRIFVIGTASCWKRLTRSAWSDVQVLAHIKLFVRMRYTISGIGCDWLRYADEEWHSCMGFIVPHIMHVVHSCPSISTRLPITRVILYCSSCGNCSVIMCLTLWGHKHFLKKCMFKMVAPYNLKYSVHPYYHKLNSFCSFVCLEFYKVAILLLLLFFFLLHSMWKVVNSCTIIWS